MYSSPYLHVLLCSTGRIFHLVRFLQIFFTTLLQCPKTWLYFKYFVRLLHNSSDRFVGCLSCPRICIYEMIQITKRSIPSCFAKRVYHLSCLCIFLLRHNRLYFNKFLPPVSLRILICWIAI